MLRHLGVKFNKPVPSFYKADSAMVTGMGVIIDEGNKKAKFPAAETVKNLYFVDKERFVDGVKTAETHFSDYDEGFVNIKAGELVKLHTPQAGERRATDQFDDTDLLVGEALSVGTDGLWKRATEEVPSKYMFDGIFEDSGKELAIIVVLNDPIENEEVAEPDPDPNEGGDPDPDEGGDPDPDEGGDDGEG